MTSTLPPIVQALSGSVGSASASTLTYPLDLITTRLQLDASTKAKRRGGAKGGFRLLLYIVYGNKSRFFKRKEGKEVREGLGWRALYDGLQSDLVATMLSNFFYFYFYSFLRSASTHGVSASITVPLMRRALGLGDVPPPSKKKHTPTMLEDIVLGFVAGVASRAVSTPLNIITLRLQEERADSMGDDDEDSASSEEGSEGGRSPSPEGKRKEDAGILDIGRMIYEEQGLKGFWKGFGTSALLSINPSITLSFFQLFRTAIVAVRKRRAGGGHVHSNLTPIQAFFVGAIANSIASTILYPLILAKKRLQSGAGTQPNATLFDVLRDAYLGKYDPHSPSPSELTGTPATTGARPTARRAKSSRYGRAGKDGEKMEGLEGLYQGWQMQILKGFFGQGTTFLIKGRIEQLVVAAYLRKKAAEAVAATVASS